MGPVHGTGLEPRHSEAPHPGEVTTLKSPSDNLHPVPSVLFFKKKKSVTLKGFPFREGFHAGRAPCANISQKRTGDPVPSPRCWGLSHNEASASQVVAAAMVSELASSPDRGPPWASLGLQGGCRDESPLARGSAQ